MNQEKISVEYTDHMGSDLSVVNAARASFGKESEWAYPAKKEFFLGNHPDGEAMYLTDLGRPALKPEDKNLIRFLATGYRTKEWEAFLQEIQQTVIDAFQMGELCDNALTALLHDYKRKAQHWAPFAHPHVQIRVSMPIFLARQFVKHQIGGTWSEESRRYISNEPGVWFPDEWHTRPEDIKQGSGDVIDMDTHNWRYEDSMDTYTGINEPWSPEAAVGVALDSYKGMVERGIAPEEARIVLPLNMMTTVVWTGSLLFWSRVVNQRVDSHAQLAAQELGKLISGVVAPLFPVSWKALTS